MRTPHIHRTFYRCALAAALAALLAGCSDEGYRPRTPDTNAEIVKTYKGGNWGADILYDKRYGCEYFAYGSGPQYAPRLDADGKPVCGKFNPGIGDRPLR